MGSAHDGRAVGRTGQYADHVADAIDDDLEAEVPHPGDDEIPTGLVLIGEGQAATSFGPPDRADLGERSQSSEQPIDINAQFARRHHTNVPDTLYKMYKWAAECAIVRSWPQPMTETLLRSSSWSHSWRATQGPM